MATRAVDEIIVSGPSLGFLFRDQIMWEMGRDKVSGPSLGFLFRDVLIVIAVVMISFRPKPRVSLSRPKVEVTPIDDKSFRPKPRVSLTRHNQNIVNKQISFRPKPRVSLSRQ